MLIKSKLVARVIEFYTQVKYIIHLKGAAVETSVSFLLNWFFNKFRISRVESIGNLLAVKLLKRLDIFIFITIT